MHVEQLISGAHPDAIRATVQTSDAALSRRQLLRRVGGATAVVAVGATGFLNWRAVDQGVFSTGEGAAYTAWHRSLGLSEDGPMNLVRAAVVAANAHNTQPWLFHVSQDRIDLHADPTRTMGSMDSLGREMYISLGCALENALLSARAHGYHAALALMPDPSNPAHVARIDLSATEPDPTPLFEAIPRRHTNRGAYDTDRPVTPATLAAMDALNEVPELGIEWLTGADDMRAFGDLTIAATEAINGDSQQSQDSFVWYRGDWNDLQAKKDGITLDAAGKPALIRTLGKILPTLSREASDQAWLDGTKDPQVSTAAAFGIVMVRDADANTQRLQAGQLYQRLHLHATTQGLAMQPLNQTVERIDRERATGIAPEITDGLANLLPESGWQAVMPFRIGYPTVEALKSPRRPAEDVVVREQKLT